MAMSFLNTQSESQCSFLEVRSQKSLGGTELRSQYSGDYRRCGESQSSYVSRFTEMSFKGNNVAKFLDSDLKSINLDNLLRVWLS